MRVKFNRGPRHGTYDFARDANDYKFLVRQLKPMTKARFFDPSPDALLEFREGEYYKSHRRLKDGTVVFEWMGWLDGKI